MADQGRSEFYVVFTMSLCTLGLKQLSPALVGFRRACRADKKSHLRVYTPDMFLQRCYGAQKTKIFLVTFGSASLYKTTCLWTSNRKSSMFLSCCEEWNEKNHQFSWSKLYIQQHAGCCFCCTSVKGQRVLKVHGNLNKRASGSMKLNWWHATTSRQPGKKYLGYNSLECAGNIVALCYVFLQVICDWLLSTWLTLFLLGGNGAWFLSDWTIPQW